MTATPLPASVRWSWPAEPASVPAARHRVMDYLREHVTLAPPLSDAGLVTSELVTNAVQHAYVDRNAGEVRVGLEFTAGHVRLTVADDGRGLVPRPDTPGLGLGLPIMATVAGDISTRTSPGKGTQVTVSFRRDTSVVPRRPQSSVSAGLERAVVLASCDGMSIDDIDESVIQPADVSEEHKAALWLLAWSYLPVDVQRSAATALLDGTSGSPFP